MNYADKLRADKQRLLEEIAEIDKFIQELEPEGDGSLTIKLDEFLNERLTDFEWLAGGLITSGGIGMLVADPKVGKTTLLVQLALCLSAGRDPWYAMRISRPVRTLYLAAEGARAPFQNRVREAARNLGVNDTVEWSINSRVVTDFRITNPSFEAMVRASQAEVCFMDTIGYFWDVEENDASLWKQRVMKPLRQIASRTGCAFVMVHHAGKEGPQAKKGWQKARGSGAMFGDVDWMARLEPGDGDPSDSIRSLIVDGHKYTSPSRWDLTFDKAGAKFG